MPRRGVGESVVLVAGVAVILLTGLLVVGTLAKPASRHGPLQDLSRHGAMQDLSRPGALQELSRHGLSQQDLNRHGLSQQDPQPMDHRNREQTAWASSEQYDDDDWNESWQERKPTQNLDNYDSSAAEWFVPYARAVAAAARRYPQVDKRSPACIRRCVEQGALHPIQCHSLC